MHMANCMTPLHNKHLLFYRYIYYSAPITYTHISPPTDITAHCCFIHRRATGTLSAKVHDLAIPHIYIYLVMSQTGSLSVKVWVHGQICQPITGTLRAMMVFSGKKIFLHFTPTHFLTPIPFPL